jgi:cytoskeletal protein CcmA (bactofilin family)
MTNGTQQTKSIIGEDVEIVGSIKCASNIQIDGKLSGDLACNGNALIGNKATIKGNITVESITIMGQVNGNVTARDRIELKSTTRLNGDIRAKRLTVEDGVTFIGKSEVNPSGTAGNRPQTEDRREPEEATLVNQRHEEDLLEEKPKGGFFGKK